MALRYDKPAPRMNKGCVTIGVIAVLVVGVPVLWSACDDDDDPDPVNGTTTYVNNHYIPGVGYYHAPFMAFFPVRFNDYTPGRGYYYGGDYHQSASAPTVTSSRPSADAVTRANTAYRATNPARRGGFGRVGSVFSSSGS